MCVKIHASESEHPCGLPQTSIPTFSFDTGSLLFPAFYPRLAALELLRNSSVFPSLCRSTEITDAGRIWLQILHRFWGFEGRL